VRPGERQLRGRGGRTDTTATAGASTALPPLNPQALRRLAGAWEMAMASAATLLPGAALCLALLAPDLVILLYGPAWQDSGALRPRVPLRGEFLHALWMLCGEVLHFAAVGGHVVEFPTAGML
jgi:hypothetical protein